MDRFNLSAWAVRRPTIVLALMLVCALGGALAYLHLGRAEDPPFTIKTAIVTVAWPGATATEMADQVADPIEEKLHSLAWFDNVQTYLLPGFAVMMVSLRDSTPASEVPRQFYQLRKKLDDVRASLPPGATKPAVNDEFGDIDSVLYAISGDGADYEQLKLVADGLGKRLERVPGVQKIDYYGEQAQRIWIDFSNAKLATLGIPPQAIFDSLSRQNAVTPAGVLQTSAQQIPLRVSGKLDRLSAVAATPVAAGGRILRLGDIAKISRGYEDPPSFLVRQQGRPAVLVGVVMRKGGDILQLGRNLDAALAEFRHGLPVGFEIKRIADQPGVVDHAVGEFMRAFAEALVIVLAVSFFSLGWRAGLVVAIAVPVVLGAVFLAMAALGIDLQRVSLGALIIALGLLVDDAIIAVEMMLVKLAAGWPKPRAAAYAWTSTAFPMLTGTLVTAAGFLPIGFARATVGEYTGDIFRVVGIALVASWFAAVLFTPYLGVQLLRARDARARGDRELYDTRIYRGLRWLVSACVRHRIVVVVASGVAFTFGVVAFLHVPQQFFPLSERPELFFDLRLPAGTSIGVTEATTKRAEALLAGDPDVRTYTSYIGEGAPRFWLGLFPQQLDPAFGEIIIVAHNVAARERIKARLMRALAAGALPQARVRVDRFTYGPPVGFPVQFRVIGPDRQELRRIAYQVRDIMQGNPDLIDPNLDWNERMPSLRLRVDQDRARALGLTPADIAATLQTLLSGYTATTMLDGTERIGVVVRAARAERLHPGRLPDLTIAVRNGVAVPLDQVAHIVTNAEEPILWRRNREPAITVRADVRDGVQAPDATAAISEIGNFRSARVFSISRPTAPVAPTTATL